MKYIDAEKIRSEVERIKEEGCASPISVCNDILSFIDFLQQEQSEVNLEKETKKWWKKHLGLEPEKQLWMDAHQSVVFARHFYELARQKYEK